MNAAPAHSFWLVIGGIGLVGRYLLSRLALEGHDVSVVTRDSKRVPMPARPVVADISQAGWLEAIDPAAFDYVVNGETITFADWLKALKSHPGVADRIRLPASLASICRGPVRYMLAAMGPRAPIALPAYKAAIFERKTAFTSDKALSHFGWRASRLFADMTAVKEKT